MKALDIANALIVRYGGRDYLTNMKLNKLVYFAYADALRESGGIFEDPIEAWPYGPVVPSVYYAFCENGGRAILRPESTSFPREAMDAADEVWDRYGFLTAIDIMGFSHRCGSAWSKAFDGRGHHTRMTDEDILGSGDGIDLPMANSTVSEAIEASAADWAETLRLLADK